MRNVWTLVFAAMIAAGAIGCGGAPEVGDSSYMEGTPEQQAKVAEMQAQYDSYGKNGPPSEGGGPSGGGPQPPSAPTQPGQ